MTRATTSAASTARSSWLGTTSAGEPERLVGTGVAM